MDITPVPIMDESQHLINEATHITTLDMTAGSHKI